MQEYLAQEHRFSNAWREAATFMQSTIVATAAELEVLADEIHELLAPYQRGARGPAPRGARFVDVSVRAVPKQ